VKHYIPRPGTFAARAVEYMAGFPLGQRFVSTTLAAALGVAPHNLRLRLETALRHGLIVKHGGSQGEVSFELRPLPKPPDAVPRRRRWKRTDPFDATDFCQRVVDAATARPLAKHGPNSVFDLAGSWK